MPATLDDSPLNTPDTDEFSGAMAPGAPAADAPILNDGIEARFLACLGSKFVCATLESSNELRFSPSPPEGEGWGEGDGALDKAGFTPHHLPPLPQPLPHEGGGGPIIASPVWIARYDARPGTTYLFRPDQHVCARWRQYDEAAVNAAIARATCND